MHDTHVYEADGKVFFRRRGNEVRTVVDCTIVRTRALLEHHKPGSGAVVLISAIHNRYEGLRFPTWFDDWSEKDDMDREHGDFQIGRPVDIAIPTVVFDHMVSTGLSPEPGSIQMGYDSSNPQDRPYSSPVAAIRIDGQWVEPIPMM